MKNSEAMSWQTFKNRLVQHPDLDLQFQYAENKWVGAEYHITEIKQAPIVSVDCGGVMNNWTEIIVQLWEPAGRHQLKAMKVNKALSIVDVVEKKLQLNPSGIVKIEFGNSQFDTRQLFPVEIIADGENLIVDLRPDFTQCKAIERGGNCGTTASEEECCTPVVAAKPKGELKNLAAESCCSSGSVCC
jgi:hypothetical protein